MSTTHRMSGKGKGKRLPEASTSTPHKKVKLEPDENSCDTSVTGKDYIRYLQFPGKQLTARNLRLFLPEMRKAAYMNSYELKQKKKFKGLWTKDHKPEDWPDWAEFMDPNNCVKPKCNKKCNPCKKPDKHVMVPIFDWLKMKILNNQPEDPRDQELSRRMPDLGELIIDTLRHGTTPEAMQNPQVSPPEQLYQIIADRSNVYDPNAVRQLHRIYGSNKLVIEPMKAEPAPMLSPAAEYVEHPTSPMQDSSNIQLLTAVKMDSPGFQPDAVRLPSKIQHRINEAVKKLFEKFQMNLEIIRLLDQGKEILEGLLSNNMGDPLHVYRQKGREFLALLEDIDEDYDATNMTALSVKDKLAAFNKENMPGDTDADIAHHIVPSTIQTYMVQAEYQTPIPAEPWIPTTAELIANKQTVEKQTEESNYTAVMSPGLVERFEQQISINNDKIKEVESVNSTETTSSDMAVDKELYNLRVRKQSNKIYSGVIPRDGKDYKIPYDNDTLDDDKKGILSGFDGLEGLVDAVYTRDLMEKILDKPKIHLDPHHGTDEDKQSPTKGLDTILSVDATPTESYTTQPEHDPPTTDMLMSDGSVLEVATDVVIEMKMEPDSAEVLLVEGQGDVPMHELMVGGNLAEMLSPNSRGSDLKCDSGTIYVDPDEQEALSEILKMNLQTNTQVEENGGYDFRTFDSKQASINFINLPVNSEEMTGAEMAAYAFGVMDKPNT